MKKCLVVFTILLFALTAAAETAEKKALNKRNVDIAKQLHYYKVIATEESNILEKYIKCLNGVNDKKMLDMCNRARHQQLAKLRRSPALKKKPE
ncbi:MAG: hypothetical protein C0602_11945 [Denitrovibrio sp.]|nr:MAG: hypothetical protein C0602_11945 [Denitrovibrio sp.]